jgi:hypothetical protein
MRRLRESLFWSPGKIWCTTAPLSWATLDLPPIINFELWLCNRLPTVSPKTPGISVPIGFWDPVSAPAGYGNYPGRGRRQAVMFTVWEQGGIPIEQGCDYNFSFAHYPGISNNSTQQFQVRVNSERRSRPSTPARPDPGVRTVCLWSALSLYRNHHAVYLPIRRNGLLPGLRHR